MRTTIAVRKHLQMLLNVKRLYIHRGKANLSDFYIVQDKNFDPSERLTEVQKTFPSATVDAKNKLLIPVAEAEANMTN